MQVAKVANTYTLTLPSHFPLLGPIPWSSVAKEMPKRTDNMCYIRWRSISDAPTIFKRFSEYYKQRETVMTNFVGRKRYRHTLGEDVMMPFSCYSSPSSPLHVSLPFISSFSPPLSIHLNLTAVLCHIFKIVHFHRILKTWFQRLQRKRYI